MRRMVTDGQDAYRVVVVTRKKIVNPDYEQGNGKPYLVLADETEQFEYGPYNKIGSAKAVLTGETIDPYEEGRPLKWGVVDGWVEKASTVWERVDLGG